MAAAIRWTAELGSTLADRALRDRTGDATGQRLDRHRRDQCDQDGETDDDRAPRRRAGGGVTHGPRWATMGGMSDVLHINGGTPLSGEITVRGAKNFVSKAMVAALLGETPSELRNVPVIRDVGVVTGLLELHGVSVRHDQAGALAVQIAARPGSRTPRRRRHR